MATSHLHDPETVEVENGVRPAKMVKSAAIGPIGTAPMRDVSALVQRLSEKDAAAFGSQFTGFTIPQALDATYDRGAGIVLVINAPDPTKHKTTIEDEVITFDKSTGQVRPAYPVVANVVVKNDEDSTVHTANMGYRVDTQADMLMNLGKAIEAGDSVKVSYEYADPSKATTADIIGGVNSVGNRAGVKLLNDSFNLYGYFTKISITPVFYIQRSIAVEFTTITEKLGAITRVSAPVGITLAQALVGRGPEGTINFNTSSDRVHLHYSHVKVCDPVINAERLELFNQRAVGLRVRVDPDKGYQRSSFNQEILGITDTERQLSTVVDDPQSEVNPFNEQGVIMVFNSYGSGLRLWGNWTAAQPAATHMHNFENVRHTGDVINESIRYFSQQYIDMPIAQALINALAESVNVYGCKMTGDDAVLGLHCWFDPARNPGMELAAGHLLLSYKYTPSPPLERLTLETEITSGHLLTLKGGN